MQQRLYGTDARLLCSGVAFTSSPLGAQQRLETHLKETFAASSPFLNPLVTVLRALYRPLLEGLRLCFLCASAPLPPPDQQLPKVKGLLPSLD